MAVSVVVIAARARWAPAFAGTTKEECWRVIRPKPSFQRTLESIGRECRGECRKSKIGPSVRWDDEGECWRMIRPNPSFQRKLESIGRERRGGRRKSKIGPSVRWDDGDAAQRNDFRRFSSIHLSACAGV